MIQSENRIRFLDFTRCVAILMIFVIHFQAHYAGYVMPLFNGTTNLSSLSSPIFFAVSGASLVLTNPAGKALSLKTFFRKRALRIYPIFYIAFFFATTIQFFLSKGVNADVPAWRIIFTIIGFDGTLLSVGIPTFYQVGEWFLGCIIYLYLLFPLLHRLMNRSKCLLIGLFCVLLIVGGSISGIPIVPWYIVMPITSFVFGMIAFSKTPKPVWGIVALGVIVFISLIKLPIDPVLYTTLHGCLLTYVLFCIGRLFDLFDRVSVKINKYTIEWFGVIGFAFILTHDRIIWWMLNVWWSPWQAPVRTRVFYVIILFLIVLLASVLLTRAERFVLKLLRKDGRTP